MSVNSIVVLMICVFAFIPLFLAEIARTKSLPTISDFLLQGRGMKIFPLYATVFATWMSAFAFMGAISYFYEQGAVYMTTIGWDALFAVLFYALGRKIWFYGKKFNYMTPTDFFDDIYRSKSLNIIVTFISLVFTLIYVQVQMVGGLFLIQVATNNNIPWTLSALVFFVILVIYLWAGGLRAVALADTFYAVLIITTIITSGIFLMHMAGGMDDMFQNVIEKNMSNVTLTGSNSGERIGLWLSLFLLVPLGAFMGPQMWIRIYASKNDRNFEVLPLLLTISSIICIGTLFAGTASVLLNKQGVIGDILIGSLMLEYANPILCAFIFIGISAALLSTANSQIHATAAIYTVDIHKKYINKNITDKNLLFVAKWSVLAISMVAYALILFIPQSVFDLGIVSFGGTMQLIVPVLGALFWKKSTAKGAVSGLATGVVSFLLLLIFTGLRGPFCAIISLLINSLIFIYFGIKHKGKNYVGERIGAYRDLSKDYFTQS